MGEPVEGTLAKYIEFKTFELIRDRLYDTIAPYAKADSKQDLYKHLFLCPSDTSKQRNFQLQGVLSPFVCIWRTSAVRYNDTEGFYSRSTLPRSFEYNDVNDELQCIRGFLYDLTMTFDIFSSSYYKDFRDRVNQDLVDLDRLRYFTFDIKELFPNCSNFTTKAEFKLEGLETTDDVDVKRAFDLVGRYTLSISVPYTRTYDYIENINLYLNNNLIYEHKATVQA